MEGKTKVIYSAMVVLAVAFPLISHADTETVNAAGEVQANQADPTSMTEGEIRRINKDAGKLTIKHGPIENLDMPAMTMVFRVADAAMLDQLQVGDKVRFIVEKLEGKYTVTRLEPGGQQ